MRRRLIRKALEIGCGTRAEPGSETLDALCGVRDRAPRRLADFVAIQTQIPCYHANSSFVPVVNGRFTASAPLRRPGAPVSPLAGCGTCAARPGPHGAGNRVLRENHAKSFSSTSQDDPEDVLSGLGGRESGVETQACQVHPPLAADKKLCFSYLSLHSVDYWTSLLSKRDYPTANVTAGPDEDPSVP